MCNICCSCSYGIGNRPKVKGILSVSFIWKNKDEDIKNDYMDQSLLL